MLETVGFDEEVAEGCARFAAADSSVARVVRVDRGVVSVLTEAGPERVTLGGGVLAAIAGDPREGPCAGDWVVLRSWPDRRLTLEHVLPRRTTVGRPAGPVLCANVDVVAVVVALHPDPVPVVLEPLLAVAGESGARPVVVLTKADLAGDTGRVAGQVDALVPATEVLVTSATTGQGLDRLRELVGAGTLGLVGASGQGRTSLTHALVGAVVLRPSDTGSELVPLPGGGAVVDTPALGGAAPTTGAEWDAGSSGRRRVRRRRPRETGPLQP